jgi:hypothetical protein
MSFTQDRELLNEYKKLRKSLYGIDPRFIGFRIFADEAAEDYEDPDDQMLILHDGKQCYGGACLRISTPQKPVILDLEEDIMPLPGKFYFSLKENLSGMELNKYAYAEFNRIVIDPRLRKGEATRRIFHEVLERCLSHRVRYMFGIGDKVRIRLYRQIYNNLGMECKIRDEITIPMREEYEGVQMLLLGGDMKSFYTKPKDPEASSLLEPSSNFEFY